MKTRLKMVLLSYLAMLGAWTAVVLAQDSMADFGLKVNELENRIVASLVKGTVPAYPDKKIFKSATSSAQTAFIRNTLSWLKTYTETEAFRSSYAQQREADKPLAPKATTADEKQAAFASEQRQGLEKLRQEMAKMPPDVQKQMQEALKQMEANIERTEKDPRMATMLKQGYEEQSASEQKTYQDQLATWEKTFPENPRELVAARLRQFLEVSRDIAFDAKLEPGTQDNVMKFADPQYEAQPKQWKLCYRAGRQPVQAARAFANEWLSQIEKR